MKNRVKIAELLVEAALATGCCVAGGLLDMSKFYDRVGMEWLIKAAIHQSVSLLAKVVLSPETCQSGPQICSGKSAHKTSLRVAGKN